MKLTAKKMVVSLLLSMTIATGAMATQRIGKEGRVLIIVSELDSSGAPELQGLYSVLEDLTNHMTRAILQDKYRKIYLLENQSATLENFKRTTYELASRPEVSAIDVIVSLHGSPGGMRFANGQVSKDRIREFMLEATTPRERVNKIMVKKKLRALYNLACYAGKDMAKLKDLGFAVTNGAKGVNANSEVELVPALTAWANGMGFKNSFNASNNPFSLALSDEPLKLAGRVANNSLKYVNSEKIFLGETDITISSPSHR